MQETPYTATEKERILTLGLRCRCLAVLYLLLPSGFLTKATASCRCFISITGLPERNASTRLEDTLQEAGLSVPP